MTITGRMRHYGDFYGLPSEFEGAAEHPDVDESVPIVLVWGNCQAEAVRNVLNTVPDGEFRTIRVPPVHELEDADLAHMSRLVARTSVVLSQPVRTGYRGLPIGTADIAELLPSSGRVVRWPVIRDNGLYPFQVIARHPSDPSAVPPAVPYHDLRTVHVAARGGAIPAPNSAVDWDVDVTADALRAAARRSVEILRLRENRDTDVAVSDALRPLTTATTNTINHPGNDVLVELANRLLAACGFRGAAVSPDRTLLGSTFAPLEARVLDALDVTGDPRPDWRHDGNTLTVDRVHRTQLEWYGEHPEFVDAALERHRDLSDLLGFSHPNRAAR